MLRTQIDRVSAVPKQRGLSLVELMVALFISAVIFAGVVNTVLSSKQSYIFDEQVAYMQENARFALDLVTRDLRSAGYMGGCDLNNADVANAVDATTAQEDFLNFNGIEGFQAAGGYPDAIDAKGVWSTTTRPDAFIIRYASSDDNIVITDHKFNSAVIDVNDNTPVEEGQILLLTDLDCRQIGITAVTEVPSTAQPKIQHNKGNGGSSTNCTGDLGGNFTCSGCPSSGNCPGDPSPAKDSYAHEYPPGSGFFKFVSRGYYIAPSSVDADLPALYSLEIDGTGSLDNEEELVAGIEDLQIMFGVDTEPTTQDGKANVYLPAYGTNGTNGIVDDNASSSNGWIGWDRIVSVKIQMVVRSRDFVYDTAQTQTLIPVADGGRVFNDRYARQLVTTTVQLRNSSLEGNAEI